MANSTYLKQVPHLRSKKVIHVKQPENDELHETNL